MTGSNMGRYCSGMFIFCLDVMIVLRAKRVYIVDCLLFLSVLCLSRLRGFSDGVPAPAPCGAQRGAPPLGNGPCAVQDLFVLPALPGVRHCRSASGPALSIAHCRVGLCLGPVRHCSCPSLRTSTWRSWAWPCLALHAKLVSSCSSYLRFYVRGMFTR